MLWMLVRAPAGPPLPVRAQRAWFELVAATNVSRHRVARVATAAGGVPAERVESGLRNVRRRASEHGGVVEMLPEEPNGTRLEWSVPLSR